MLHTVHTVYIQLLGCTWRQKEYMDLIPFLATGQASQTKSRSTFWSKILYNSTNNNDYATMLMIIIPPDRAKDEIGELEQGGRGYHLYANFLFVFFPCHALA